ncbi:MAG: phosphatidylglycerophosphatase A [Planctomycetes bacterium]|nr:phosphatidylglycerophosphatase A [Planctomycetota bacterium]
MTIARKLIVSGLGTGFLWPAPGTWGSAAACGAWLGVFAAVKNHIQGGCLWAAMSFAAGLIAVVAAAACAALGGFAEKTFGRKDPPQCTIDEWAGQSLALVCLPLGGGGWHDVLIVAGAAFVAFRFFDILKPPPIRRFERLPAGWGIAADDLMAGVYANIVCQLVLRLWLKL